MDDRATPRPATRPHSRAIGALLLVAVVTACDRNPVAPQRVRPVEQVQVSPLVHLEGLVVDGVGKPVSGATVTALSLETMFSLAKTTSDDEGAYSFSFPTPAPLHPIKVERDGFEPSRHYVDLSAENEGVVRRDLRLHRIWRVRAGESVTLAIDIGDPGCDDFLDSWTCRTIRVVNPGATYVRAWVTDGRAVLKQAGSSGSAWSRVDVHIAGGEEVVLEVMALRLPLTVTLYTSYD